MRGNPELAPKRAPSSYMKEQEQAILPLQRQEWNDSEGSSSPDIPPNQITNQEHSLDEGSREYLNGLQRNLL